MAGGKPGRKKGGKDRPVALQGAAIQAIANALASGMSPYKALRIPELAAMGIKPSSEGRYLKACYDMWAAVNIPDREAQRHTWLEMCRHQMQKALTHKKVLVLKEVEKDPSTGNAHMITRTIEVDDPQFLAAAKNLETFARVQGLINPEPQATTPVTNATALQLVQNIYYGTPLPSAQPAQLQSGDEREVIDATPRQERDKVG